jgi:tetratricopeptide (TPR) repeat protein
MDTAFAKTEALKPDCKSDIDVWRRYLWVPTFNAGVAAWQANNTDSAIASFRRSIPLLPNEPTSYKYVATLYYNAGQAESALVAVARPRSRLRTRSSRDRKDALYNLGRIQQSLQKRRTRRPRTPNTCPCIPTIPKCSRRWAACSCSEARRTAHS